MPLPAAARIGLALLSFIGSLAAAPPEGATPLTLISPPTLSPDGKTMAFEWALDLWTASTGGGEAKRITRHPGRDVRPRFTPDGKRIFFSSDRSGSLQVHSIPAGGGKPVQHTRNSGGNRLECLSPDGSRAIVRGLREAPGFRSYRLMEIDLTTDRRERRLFDTPGHSASWSPDGTRLLFCRRGELSFRKGYTGSRASRIWLHQPENRTFECLVAEDTESGSPLWHPDGESYYYVSSRGGTANLWLRKPEKQPVRLTEFKDDGVMTPSISADGSTLVFRVGLDVLRYRPERDPEPVPLELWTREALDTGTIDSRHITGTSDCDFTPDLQRVVFSAADELWSVTKPGAPAQRLTETSTGETQVRFIPGSADFYFLREDGISADYYRTLDNKGDTDNLQQITFTRRSKSRLSPSPDGNQIAWIEGTGDLFVTPVDGSIRTRRLFKCWDKPTFDWSPDSRWIVLAAKGPDSDRDLWIVAADGETPARNITRRPGFEGSPRWSPDGRHIAFTARRDGAADAGLWLIDVGDPDALGKLDAKSALTLGDSARQLSTKGIEPTRVIWQADSKSLLFQSRNPANRKVYQLPIGKGSMKTLATKRGIPIRTTTDGTLVWRVNRTPELLTNGTSVRYPIDCDAKRPRPDVLTLGFRRVWRTLRERFYDPDMNGLDWHRVWNKYQAAATSARSSHQFDRVIAQLLGELNASHLSFHRRRWPDEKSDPPRQFTTAHPGLVFRDDARPPDSPLIIRKVIAGSPVALLANPPEPGDTVLRIAGEPVTHRTPLHRFFNDAEKRPIPLAIQSAGGSERALELRCLSYPAIRALVAKNQIATAKQRVSSTSHGIIYHAVPDMSRDSLDALALAIHRAPPSASGLILDLRENGGGREADRMLNLFCQPVHSTTIPRDGPEGYPLDRLPAPAWNKPLVVLCNENTYSNAEIFCHAVQQIGRAPLVGTASAGGVISAVSRSIPDLGTLQVPFRGWYLHDTRKNLDLNGAKPDHPVELGPADEDADRDPQLAKAMQVLLTSER